MSVQGRELGVSTRGAAFFEGFGRGWTFDAYEPATHPACLDPPAGPSSSLWRQGGTGNGRPTLTVAGLGEPGGPHDVADGLSRSAGQTSPPKLASPGRRSHQRPQNHGPL